MALTLTLDLLEGCGMRLLKNSAVGSAYQKYIACLLHCNL